MKKRKLFPIVLVGAIVLAEVQALKLDEVQAVQVENMQVQLEGMDDEDDYEAEFCERAKKNICIFICNYYGPDGQNGFGPMQGRGLDAGGFGGYDRGRGDMHAGYDYVSHGFDAAYSTGDSKFESSFSAAFRRAGEKFVRDMFGGGGLDGFGGRPIVDDYLDAFDNYDFTKDYQDHQSSGSYPSYWSY